MRPNPVLVDANVWVSRTLRDWIYLIYQENPGLFQACWTEDILAETLKAVRRRYPKLNGEQARWVRRGIVGTFPDGEIADFLVEDGDLSVDKFDGHVLAAARGGGVAYLVTDDGPLLSQPDEVKDQLEFEIMSADDFLVLVDDASPEAVRCATEKNIRYHLQKGPEVDLPLHLKLAQCHGFAERVRRRLLEIL